MGDLEKGKALFKEQQYNQAIKVLNNFLSKQNNNADGLYIRAMCFRKINEFEKSIDDLNIMLQRLPNEPTLLCERGISHFHNKNIVSAIKDMDKAVEIDPNNPYRYSSRAYIKTRVDPEGAINDYKKAIALDPKDEISYNNLGLLEENMGRMANAKKHFNSSNKIIGYNPEKRKVKEPKPNLSIIKIMLKVFTSSNTRREYFNFLKSFFKRNS